MKAYRIIYVLLSLLALGVVIFFVARIYLYFKKSNDDIQQLVEHPISFDYHQPMYEWRDAGGSQDSILKEEVIADYIKSWAALNRFINHGDTSFLPFYFHVDLMEDIKKSNSNISRVDLKHSIDFHFVSLDKTLVSFTDRCAEIVEVEPKNQFYHRYEMGFKVIAQYQDGYWKILQCVPMQAICDSIDQVNNNNQETVEWSTGIKGVNYYPSSYPWHWFWDSFDLDLVIRDLERIQSLDLNTLRIFIPYFSDLTDRENYLGNINNFLAECDKRNLKLILTLFDFPKSYNIEDYPHMKRYLHLINKVVLPYAKHVVWDIKNEADLDFEHHGFGKVQVWCQFIIDEFRTHYPNSKLTIGWSNPAMASLLAEKLDVVSFHYYENPKKFLQAYNNLRLDIPDLKPIWLTEFGMSTWNRFWWPWGRSESDQEEHYRRILKVCEDEQIPFLFWTLYDFHEVPDEVAGKLPWRKGLQKEYGIFDAQNNPKPAASLFK